MSGLISPIANLFGGHAKNTDRKEQLSGYGDLNNVFNFGLNNAKSEQRAGADLEGDAGSYFRNLVSGNRATVNQAIAPVANAATEQTDAEKRQIAASGTARGGGVNATTQNLDAAKQTNIDNAILSAQSGGARGEAAVGENETSDAARLLGISSSTASDIAGKAGDSRALSDKLHRETAADAGDLGDSAAKIISQLYFGGGS